MMTPDELNDHIETLTDTINSAEQVRKALKEQRGSFDTEMFLVAFRAGWNSGKKQNSEHPGKFNRELLAAMKDYRDRSANNDQ